MGVKQWFVDLLSRGGAPEPDPDEMIELQTASLPDAPLIIAAQQDAGIDATTVDRFDPVSALTRAVVVVGRADAPAARATLERR